MQRLDLLHQRRVGTPGSPSASHGARRSRASSLLRLGASPPSQGPPAAIRRTMPKHRLPTMRSVPLSPPRCRGIPTRKIPRNSKRLVPDIGVVVTGFRPRSVCGGRSQPIAPLAQQPRISRSTASSLPSASPWPRACTVAANAGAPVPRRMPPATGAGILHRHHAERARLPRSMRTTRSAERASAADITSGPTAASVPGSPRSNRSAKRRDVLELHRRRAPAVRVPSRAPALISVENGAAGEATSSILDAIGHRNWRWPATVTTRCAGSRSRTIAASSAGLAAAATGR